MKAGKTTLAVILILVVAAAGIVALDFGNEASAARPGRRTRSTGRILPGVRPQPTMQQVPPKVPLPVQFIAAIYTLKVPAETAENMDVSAISAKVTDNTAFRKELAKLGKVGFAYSVDQQINLSEPATMEFGQRVPMVASSHVTDSGSTINTVRYQQIGAILEVSGTRENVGNENAVNLKMKIETSSLTDSNVETTPGGSKSPVIMRNSLDHHVVAEFDKPFAAMAVSSIGKVGESDEVIAHVYRFSIAKVGG